MDMPKNILVERIVGGALAGAGALFLLVHAGSIPGFVITLVIGFGGGGDFWPMLGASLLLLAGIGLLVHAGRRRRRHIEFVVVQEDIRKRHGRPAAAAAPPAPMRFPAMPFPGDEAVAPKRTDAAPLLPETR